MHFKRIEGAGKGAQYIHHPSQIKNGNQLLVHEMCLANTHYISMGDPRARCPRAQNGDISKPIHTFRWGEPRPSRPPCRRPCIRHWLRDQINLSLIRMTHKKGIIIPSTDDITPAIVRLSKAMMIDSNPKPCTKPDLLTLTNTQCQ